MNPKKSALLKRRLVTASSYVHVQSGDMSSHTATAWRVVLGEERLASSKPTFEEKDIQADRSRYCSKLLVWRNFSAFPPARTSAHAPRRCQPAATATRRLSRSIKNRKTEAVMPAGHVRPSIQGAAALGHHATTPARQNAVIGMPAGEQKGEPASCRQPSRQTKSNSACPPAQTSPRVQRRSSEAEQEEEKGRAAWKGAAVH